MILKYFNIQITNVYIFKYLDLSYQLCNYVRSNLNQTIDTTKTFTTYESGVGPARLCLPFICEYLRIQKI